MELIHSVYFLLMIGLFGSLLYIANLIVMESKKKALLLILFPPYLFFYVLLNFNKTKDSIIMAAIFLTIITFVGFIGGEPFGAKAVYILELVFLWPIYAYKYAYSFCLSII